MSEWLPFHIVKLACAALLVALTGCSGFSGVTTAGGRPLIYKQGPGDAPSSIQEVDNGTVLVGKGVVDGDDLVFGDLHGRALGE